MVVKNIKADKKERKKIQSRIKQYNEDIVT